MVSPALVVSISAVVAAGALAGGPRAAHADEPSLGGFAAGAADRARRAVSFGPTIGAGIAYRTDVDTVEAPLSFGLGLVVFAIPVVPSPAAIEEMIKTRVKARVKARLEAMVVAGQPAPDEQEVARIAAEVLTEVKAEILGQRRYQGRTLERPRLAVGLEGSHGLRNGARRLRATIGLGVSKVTVGPTLAMTFAPSTFTDVTGLTLGGEVAAHLTPRPRPRSHVIDVFLRVDAGVVGDGPASYELGLGARLLLDLI